MEGAAIHVFVCMFFPPRKGPLADEWIHKHSQMSLLLWQRNLFGKTLATTCMIFASIFACICVVFYRFVVGKRLRKRKIKEWWDMKTSACWRQERPSNSAVKLPPPSLHFLPGGQPGESPPDQMHTWHHGVGREFCTSAIASCSN